MIQKDFAQNVATNLKQDKAIIGLAVAGSWLTNEIDEFSDLDLIVVTKQKITDDKNNMLAYARSFGSLLSGFTGEHVGEPRVLICLYDDPLLHVDIKFLTLSEFHHRVETPVILLDTDDQLKEVLENTAAAFPYPDYQWIEDRFWTWIHYTLLKIGRGEYLEAYDFFGYLRITVFGPLLHIKNGNLPRGVRKVETLLSATDLETLLATLPTYTKEALLESLKNSIVLYKNLRKALFPPTITRNIKTEQRVLDYFAKIKHP